MWMPNVCPKRTAFATLAAFVCALGLLTGCSSTAPAAQPEPGAMLLAAWPVQLSTLAQTNTLPQILLLGEQHDAPEHQQWEHATVQWLAARHQLAAVALEMAHAGHDTRHLPIDATPEQVQNALDWRSAGWPWEPYAATVMTAVRAGIPVIGGNLPRSEMRAIMGQPQWDQHLPDIAWQRQRRAIDTGHCGLLPETQLTPMARVQLAKDARMAEAAAAHMVNGKTVVLIAGRGHVLRSLGIPTWLPAHLHIGVAVAEAHNSIPTPVADRNWLVQTPPLPPEDHCTQLRAQWRTPSTNAARIDSAPGGQKPAAPSPTLPPGGK